ncbi:MAG: hypothetical protein BMS9Abin17_0083 [Acidimicrobiia bacterium]|nr:MAG: hypothetical protein BMS9Abin17_0083 [Acidimicrobiia bacterium]
MSAQQRLISGSDSGGRALAQLGCPYLASGALVISPTSMRWRADAGDPWGHAMPKYDMMGSKLIAADQVGDATVANKDKGGKSSKKAASKSLKEKRQAKKDKRAGNSNKPTPM